MSELPFTEYNEATAGSWEWEIGNDVLTIDASLAIILGYAPGEISNELESWKQRIAPKYLDLLQYKYQAHVESHGKTPFALEVGMYHKNGTTSCILFTGKVIVWKQPNIPGKITGSYFDITPHKLIERELRQVKDLLNKTNQTALVGGWELDLETNVVIWTEVTKNIFEVPEDFVPQRGSGLVFFKAGPERNGLINAIDQAINKGIPYDVELKMTTAKGVERWVRTVGQPEFANGKCIRLFGVFQDINEKKVTAEALRIKQEEIQHATAAKLEFLAVMSHEIRTPMNAVIGFTNLLLLNPREDQREYLSVLKFSAENLLILINDILDFNKIDAGKVIFEDLDFDIRELLENIIAAQKQDADEKDLKLTLQFDEKIPQLIMGDPIRLGQVITNLVANAIKFTPVGEVQISTKLIAEDDNTVNLYFEVSDTGIGIPKDKLEFIFETFTQASSETTRKYGGTGLGLSISKRLLDLVGCQLNVKSKPQKGSSFYFELNFKKSTLKQSDFKTEAAHVSQPGFPGKRVLITEDNPVNVMVVRKFLEKWMIDCDVAQNGLIAVEKVAGNSYDLVLMDLQMPEMDGYAATVAIRNMAGDIYKKLPIIALTASVVPEMEDRIKEAGMNDCVSKPFKPSVLYSLLSHYLLEKEK